jgi:hypothetical protein
MTDMSHLKFLDGVAIEDVVHLREKEATYKGSWKRRGGVGAFMMLARKWDRLESMMASRSDSMYDIFAHIHREKTLLGRDGTVLAEIRDLRRYLLLVEAEMVVQGAAAEPNALRRSRWNDDVHVPGTPVDGGHHEMTDSSHHSVGIEE